MRDSLRHESVRYRVWIVRQGDQGGQADGRTDAPGVFVEPAEKRTMSPRRAARYVATFNRVAAAHGRALRAVALPVAVRYEGDPVPGQAVPLATFGLSANRP